MSEPDPYRRSRSPLRRVAVLALLLSHAAVGLTVWGLMKPRASRDAEIEQRLADNNWLYRVHRFPPFGPKGATVDLELRTVGIEGRQGFPHRHLSRSESVTTNLCRWDWEVRNPPQPFRIAVQLADLKSFGSAECGEAFRYWLVTSVSGAVLHSAHHTHPLPWINGPSRSLGWTHRFEWEGDELYLWDLAYDHPEQSYLHSLVLVVTPRY